MKHAPRPNGYRDSWAGQLTADRADTEARVAGWVNRRRDHGGLIFIDLRDRSGIVQLVFHPENAPEAHERAHALRSEDVISAFGTVTRREPQNVNPNIATGEIELTVSSLEILADAETPPFPLDEGADVDEILRLRHRSLDLRRRPAAAHDRAASPGDRDDARSAERARLPRDRDPVPDPLDPGGRARLPGAGADRSPARSTRCRSRPSCSSSC